MSKLFPILSWQPLYITEKNTCLSIHDDFRVFLLINPSSPISHSISNRSVTLPLEYPRDPLVLLSDLKNIL